VLVLAVVLGGEERGELTCRCSRIEERFDLWGKGGHLWLLWMEDGLDVLLLLLLG
jgi:hypothetical protein